MNTETNAATPQKQSKARLFLVVAIAGIGATLGYR